MAGTAYFGEGMTMSSGSKQRQNNKAILAYRLRRDGLTVGETAEKLGISREKVRVFEVLGERLDSVQGYKQ